MFGLLLVLSWFAFGYRLVFELFVIYWVLDYYVSGSKVDFCVKKCVNCELRIITAKFAPVFGGFFRMVFSRVFSLKKTKGNLWFALG